MKASTLNLIINFLGELIATCLLVFLGCMGCIKSDVFPNNHLQMGFNFGLVIMMLVIIFSHITGSHINPAVSVAAVILRLVSPLVGAVYIVAQLLGGFIGYGLLKTVVPANVINAPGSTHGMCVTAVNSEINIIQAVAIEFILTMVLIIVCGGVWDPRNHARHDSVPIKLGLAVASLAITGGSFTGASMNPARSFGPALWNADFEDHWIYWVGPMLGGAVGAILYKAVFWKDNVEEKDAKLRAMEELPLR